MKRKANRAVQRMPSRVFYTFVRKHDPMFIGPLHPFRSEAVESRKHTVTPESFRIAKVEIREIATN